jgi:hypothetical protein
MTTATLTTRNEPRQVEDNFFKVGNTCYTLADKISTVEVTKYTSDYRAETVYVVRCAVRAGPTGSTGGCAAVCWR